MAGFTPFTSNYSDLSDENGYQFEFRCDICGSGYRSEFIRSNLGTAGNILGGASNLLGGFFGGASSVADRAKDITDRGARDDALKKASNEIMQFFQRCPRNNLWVDETCWNEARGLCVSCAPKLAAEMEAERSGGRDPADAPGDADGDGLHRRHQHAHDRLHQLRQAGRFGEVLLELRDAGRACEVSELRQRRRAGRHASAGIAGRVSGSRQPARVPHTVQKRAPAGSAAPQPEHRPAPPAGAGMGAAAGAGVGAAAGAGGEVGAVDGRVPAAVVAADSSAAVRFRPHFGQAIQPA